MVDRIKEWVSDFWRYEIRYRYYNISSSIYNGLKRIGYIWSQGDFDYAYVLHAELEELKILRDGINKYQSHLNYERDLERLDTAIRMLTMIANDDYYYHSYLVNTRNASRYMSEDQIKSMNDNIPEYYKEELYCRKVWRIYHKYREQYMRTWWD